MCVFKRLEPQIKKIGEKLLSELKLDDKGN